MNSFLSQGIQQSPGTPAWYMAASHTSKSHTLNLTRVALVSEEATKYLSRL